MYTDEELDAISHERLYRLFQIARAKLCDYECNSFMDDDFGEPESNEQYTAELYDNYERTKAALSRRPYRKFDKATKRKEQQQKLAGLRGNRRRRTGK